MRLLRTIAVCIGGLVALLVLIVVAVWLFVNPNDYKDRIVREVKIATGRDLALPGAIKLSVFPWVALELGPASLGNPGGFSGPQFMSVQHVALRVKLLPLLHKNLQIGRIEVDQLDLHLFKNSQGKGNWEDFGKQSTPATGPDNARAPSGSIFESLAGIVVSSSRISYDTLNITDVNLDVGDVTHRPAGPYGLSDLSLTGKLKSNTGAPDLPFKFTTAALALDLAAQTFRAPMATAQFGSAKLSGSLTGEQIIDSPAFSGELTLEPVALRELMSELGVTLPKTRDAQAFSRLSAKTDFHYTAKSIQFPTLEGQLDDSRLHGSAGLTDLDTKATNFALALDHIDIDRYRSPRESAPVPAAPEKPAELPTSALKPLEVHGTFVIGSAKFSGLTFSDLSLTLVAHDGLIQLSALKARVYGGEYAGDIAYDIRGAEPQLRLSQQLTGIDMTPLLKDAVNSQRLSGHGNANATLAGHGLTSRALVKSLSGRMALNLANGAIEGVDLGYEIGVAQALLKRQPLPAGANTRHTKFDAFKMSATIADGVAKTDDLTIATPYLRVTGQGTTNLASEAIDLKLVATVLKAPADSTAADLSPLMLAQIPVSVTGTAGQPKVRPDVQGILKSQLQQKAKDLIKDKLNDRLKGFFGTH